MILPSVLCPESVPQAHMLRLTKCKDSENDGHNAAMRTSRRKCVHWVLKMFINQNTILLASFPGPHPASRCLQYGKRRKAGQGPGNEATILCGG